MNTLCSPNPRDRYPTLILVPGFSSFASGDPSERICESPSRPIRDEESRRWADRPSSTRHVQNNYHCAWSTELHKSLNRGTQVGRSESVTEVNGWLDTDGRKRCSCRHRSCHRVVAQSRRPRPSSRVELERENGISQAPLLLEASHIPGSTRTAAMTSSS